MEDLLFYPLHKLSDLILHRKISSIDLITIFYYHILKYNQKINAVTDLKPLNELLLEAEILDKQLSQGLYKGLLHGIPMTVKDAFNVATLKTSNGHPLFKNHIVHTDAYLVTKLKNAGAIIIGKTNLPLFGIDWKSENSWFGRTNNPYDLQCVPGGSSGGSAAALAAGFTPAELGSDAGGSIRVPAHFCGICGLRTTEGLLSNDGHFQFPNKPKGLRYLTVPGPMARNVKDLNILLNILCNNEPISTTQNSIDLNQFLKAKHAPLNIAYSKTINNVEVDKSYQEIFTTFLNKLKAQGHQLTEEQPQYDNKKSYLSWATIIGFDFGISMPSIPLKNYFMQLFIYIKYRDKLWAKGMQKGISGNPKAYATALEYKDEVSKVYHNFLTNYDIWLTPVAADCAFKHQRTGKSFIINNKKVKYTEALASFNFNTALSGHPICVIPIGFIKGNMPVGIQIHAKKWHDKRLLQIAESFEMLTNGFSIPNMFKNE